jgi:hypothetical protein
MHVFVFSYPTLAVAATYCIWQAYVRAALQRHRLLRERITYMLWTMAHRIG